jgi:hypothetical protein
MKKIALLPGGFKPPHAGHYNMAKWLAKNTDADVVVVKVGAKERDGITREMSLQLWNLYKESDSDPLSNKLLIQPSTSNSPVRDVYDFVEQTAPEGSTVYLGMGEKDTSDSRFKNIGKFAEPRNIKFETVLVPPQAGGVSGTDMRGFIKNNQDTFFYNALPDHMTDMDKEDAWAIVIPNPMNEDLYDPNDHVSDYMKSSEWKAGMPDGPKKDINPSYKYHRAGLYGKMYNETVTDTDINLYPFKITDKTYDEEDNSLITTEYKFITPNNTYRIEFYSGEYNPEVKTFDLSFGVDKGELNTIDTFQMTGEGNARKIFKTILNITKDFINKEDVNKIVVDGTDEKRKRIYKTIFSSTPPEISDKIELKEAILNETVTEHDIICDNCGWTWGIVDGGDDLYICHTCGHDNTPDKMNEQKLFSKEWWRGHINEIMTEAKANTHLTHLEELVLTQGQDGYNQAKSFLYELIKNLKGEDNSIKNVSVKWDGAPALFTGINPDNGQFFVGTKSVFNKEPKINYTPQDVDMNHGHAPGLAVKLKLALQYLPPLGITGILQGDFMFDNNEVETNDIDGVSHYTFRPNTIRYAIEANSELGNKILAAKIGIIFHTTYRDLKGSGASFGADVSGLNPSSDVWFDDAYFKDATGVLLSDEEEQLVLSKINEADSINVNYGDLPMDISSNAKVNLLNTYLNSEIRRGEFITDPQRSFETFKEWYQEKIEKAVAKISPKNQETKRNQYMDKLQTFESKKDVVINLFRVSKLLSEAKNIFIAKYDKAVATKHFIDNGDGTLSVTKAEGFVAVDHTESGIKLVDRLEFSRNNFNAGKPGAKK